MIPIYNVISDCPSSTMVDKYAISKAEPYDPKVEDVAFKIQSGNTGSYFTISPAGGFLKVRTAAYSTFLRSRTYYLVIRCTDENGSYLQKKWKVTLKKDINGNIQQTPLPVLVP